MPLYVALVNFTDQGIKNFRDTVRRAEDYRGLVEKHGGQVRQLLWTLGQYDLVVVTELPDDETAAAVVLQTVAGGNVRTTTLKAFDAEQMRAILQRSG
ncbi:MAG TPA: GYD domain-containing protein [Propionibacteriaceae bacterium]|nr:GYD domain-containing protein [Propionibacteriaceae bacterium]